MATIVLPGLTSVGTVTVTFNSRTATGDATTLSVLKAGDLLMVDGAAVIQAVASDPAGSPTCTFTLVEPWAGATLTAAGWKTTDGIEDEAYDILVQTDRMGLFAGRTTYDAQASGFDYLSADGAGSASNAIMYQRQTTVAGTWITIDGISYYVDPTGSDTANDGLTAATPFLTITKAITTLAALDLTGNSASIFVAAGTYSENVVLKDIRGAQDAGQITISGAGATSIISGGAGNALLAKDLKTIWDIQSVKLQSTSLDCLNVENAYVRLSSVTLGAAGVCKVRALPRGRVEFNGNYTDIGNAKYHWFAGGGTIKTQARTLTLSSTPAYTNFFACAADNGTIQCANMTFSGTATTPTDHKYEARGGGGINTNGAGLSYLPGSGVKGIVTPPGYYK